VRYRVIKPFTAETIGTLETENGIVVSCDTSRFRWAINRPASELISHCKGRRLVIKCSDTGKYWNDIVWRLI